MFHLFKKTYLHIDGFINKDEDRIVISATQGFPLLSTASNLFVGRLFAHGTQMSNVVGPTQFFPSFKDLITFCFEYNQSTDRKIVIYLDQQAWMEFTSKWFKTIFVNIDADSAYKIQLAYFNQLIMIGGRGEKYLSDQYREFLFSKSEFSEVFNNTTIDAAEKQEILSTISGFRSYEFLVGSYLYNGSHSEELKQVMFIFMNRWAEEHFKEVWRGIQESLLSPKIVELFRLRTYTLENMLEMVDDPALQTFRATNAWRELGGVANVHEPMNITNFTPSQIEELKEGVRLLHGLTSFGNTAIDIAHRGYILDSEVDSILDKELHSSEVWIKVWSLRDLENVRAHLIKYFIFNQDNDLAMAPFFLE